MSVNLSRAHNGVACPAIMQVWCLPLAVIEGTPDDAASNRLFIAAFPRRSASSRSVFARGSTPSKMVLFEKAGLEDAPSRALPIAVAPSYNPPRPWAMPLHDALCQPTVIGPRELPSAFMTAFDGALGHGLSPAQSSVKALESLAPAQRRIALSDGTFREIKVDKQLRTCCCRACLFVHFCLVSQ
jgi:hypothetical protein